MKLQLRLGIAALSAIFLCLPWVFLLPGWVLFAGFVPLFLAGQVISERNQPDAFLQHLTMSFTGFFLWNVCSAWWLGLATCTGLVLFLFLNSMLMTSVWMFYIRVKNRTSENVGLAAFVAGWMAFEFLHLHWDLALPGMTLGGTFGNQSMLVQWYEYTGVLGGSLWILLANVFLYKLICSLRSRKAWLRAAVAFAGVITIPVLISVLLYSSYEPKGTSVKLAVVQPNINPYTEKFNETGFSRQVALLAAQTDSALAAGAKLVVLPETALPSVWEDSLLASAWVKPFLDLARQYPHATIVVGANTRKFLLAGHDSYTSRHLDDGRLYDEFNSALCITDSASVQVYHKQVLVSGVEKTPFGRYFSFLKSFFFNLGGTSGGLSSAPGVDVFEADSLRFAPVICFESMFGDYLGAFFQKGAGMMLVLTNDGWWKRSPGAKLHFSYARLRAIEFRCDIARSANTGVSGFINRKGEVLSQTTWWTKTVSFGVLHPTSEKTFYAQYGDWLGWLAVLVLAAFPVICGFSFLKKHES